MDVGDVVPKAIHGRTRSSTRPNALTATTPSILPVPPRLALTSLPAARKKAKTYAKAAAAEDVAVVVVVAAILALPKK